jgi:Family of unknown function (DUF6232)
MTETVFLSENNVQVTNARFIVSGQTYAMNGITSVKNARQNPSRTLPIIVGLIGLCIIGSGDALFLGIVAMGIAIAIFVMSKSKHVVVLNTSGGQVEALSSTDTDHIVRIIAALNDAIIHRG